MTSFRAVPFELERRCAENRLKPDENSWIMKLSAVRKGKFALMTEICERWPFLSKNESTVGSHLIFRQILRPHLKHSSANDTHSQSRFQHWKRMCPDLEEAHVEVGILHASFIPVVHAAQC